MDRYEKWQIAIAIVGSIVLVILLVIFIQQFCLLLADPTGLAFIEAILQMAK